MDDDFQPEVLVRTFSEKLCQSIDEGSVQPSALQAVVADDYRLRRQDAQWRRWFEPWAPESVNDRRHFLLQPQAVRLSRAWSAFRTKVPENERAQFDARAPNFQDVMMLMEQTGTKWDQDRKKGTLGAIRTWYQRCCVKIKAHEGLLKIIPEDSEYCSLFTGVIKSIVYATANHEKIAAGFAKAFAEISDNVAACEDSVRLYSTKRMQELIMDVYTSVFLFLTDVLDWYIQKRINRVLQSFNQDLYDDFQEQLREIQRKTQSIRQDGMHQGQAAEIRSTRLTAEWTQEELMILRSQWEKDRKARERLRLDDLALDNARNHKQRELAAMVVELLENKAKDAIVEIDVQQSLLRISNRGIVSRSPSPAAVETQQTEAVEARSWSREIVLQNSRHLEDFFDRERVRIDYDPSSVTIPREAMGHLQRFIKAEQSSMLAIAAPEMQRTIGPGSMSKVAARIVEFADTAGIPVVSYFCTLDSTVQLHKGKSSHRPAVTALLCSLIRQMVEVWATETKATESDFSEQAFTALDGKYRSWSRMVELLESTFDHAPRMLYCVIDGFQLLDDDSTVDALRGLMRFLRRNTSNAAGSGILFKVLMTMSGRSRYLDRKLDRDQLVFTGRGAHRRGRAPGLAL